VNLQVGGPLHVVELGVKGWTKRMFMTKILSSVWNVGYRRTLEGLSASVEEMEG